MEVLTKAQYNAYLTDANDPELGNVPSIEQMCYEAQTKLLTEVNFNTPENPPLIVPLKTITHLTGKYQWGFTTTNEPNQMRKITKITLI